jgi:hypothetical protein
MPPTSWPPKDGTHPFDLEPALPPADSAEGAEQDGTNNNPRVAGRQEQQDVGAKPDFGITRSAVTIEQSLVFRRG